MGRIGDLFSRASLDKLIQQAQRRLAAEDFDQARKIVQRGLELYPDADPLHDLELTIRRAQARTGIQSLKARIERNEDARAYEQLISLYLELGLFAEARHEALAYANAHPDRDAAHLLLGEMSLQAFFEDLRANDAHGAERRLLRAAALNTEAVKPRLLLAELYYCTGADRALAAVVRDLEAIAEGDPLLEPVLEKLKGIASGEAPTSHDGLFERIEVEGALVREPTTWPLRSRRSRVSRLDEDRAERAARALVEAGSAAEIVMLQRGGTLIAHVRGTPDGESVNPRAEGSDKGLVDVTRTVARMVARYAREFDLGAFRRCTIQGPFGIVAVGEVGGVVTGARWNQNPEPQRLWERVSVHLEGSLGGKR